MILQTAPKEELGAVILQTAFKEELDAVTLQTTPKEELGAVDTTELKTDVCHVNTYVRHRSVLLE